MICELYANIYRKYYKRRKNLFRDTKSSNFKDLGTNKWLSNLSCNYLFTFDTAADKNLNSTPLPLFFVFIGHSRSLEKHSVR